LRDYYLFVNFYKEWKGDLFQVDDIVVGGVKI
jgi:hypothetical protein